MDKSVETIILSSLIFNEEFSRKVIPHIKDEYFDRYEQKVIFQEIFDFVETYKNLPNTTALLIEIENRNDINEDNYKEITSIINSFEKESHSNDWLVATTEKWCKDRALYNALIESVKIADGTEKEKTKDSIPNILQDALAVSFDNQVGHDFFEDYEKRYEFYTRNEERIPFDIEMLNKITKGGLPRKTLTVLLSGTGVGKSLTMCHMASAAILQSKNVLYITLEMAEERIAERIDANLLNVKINEISNLSKSFFESKLLKLTEKTNGKLIIKEYPTSSAHVGHFRALLNELSIKKSFVPDIIFVDYLNICASSRFRGNNINSYTIVKSIAEEIRGMAVEFNVPIISATQLNRNAANSSELESTDVAESFGISQTVDALWGITQTEELKVLNQYMFKQLKNRFSDLNLHKRFVVGVDKYKMRLYDIEDSGQREIIDDSPSEEKESKKEKLSKFKF
jgi:replicative DNA helicase